MNPLLQKSPVAGFVEKWQIEMEPTVSLAVRRPSTTLCAFSAEKAQRPATNTDTYSKVTLITPCIFLLAHQVCGIRGELACR